MSTPKRYSTWTDGFKVLAVVHVFDRTQTNVSAVYMIKEAVNNKGEKYFSYQSGDSLLGGTSGGASTLKEAHRQGKECCKGYLLRSAMRYRLAHANSRAISLLP
jgi:hypothetical protein